jgi:hypothetical protein
MSRKSWLIDRRTLLKGAGVSLALPLLDCMGDDKVRAERPKRFCAVYFPYGSVFLKDDSELAAWNWTPKGEGTDYQFGQIHRSFEPLRNELTMLQGLSHPQGRSMGGHDTADIWLTGTALTGSRMKNSKSVDQVIAAHNSDQTRFSSLVLSTDGGVGEPTPVAAPSATVLRATVRRIVRFTGRSTGRAAAHAKHARSRAGAFPLSTTSTRQAGSAEVR